MPNLGQVFTSLWNGLRPRLGGTLFLVTLFLDGGAVWAGSALNFPGFAQALDTGGVTTSLPSGIAVTANGTVYIADRGNHQIIKVSPQGAGALVSMAGLVPALAAPSGVAVDGSGNLYVADTGNNRVVMVPPSGAGSVLPMGSVNLNGPTGLALDASGNLFISDTGNNQIVARTSGGSVAVLTITLGTALSAPAGLAMDLKGALYIADSGHSRIVKVPAGSTTGTVVALSGQSLLTPKAVAVDRIGNLYIADYGNSRIVLVDTAGKASVLNTLAANLSLPKGVALDPFGTIYIADTGNSRALVVAPALDPAMLSSDPGYTLNKSVVNFGHLTLGTTTPVTLTLPVNIGGTPVGAFKAFCAGIENLDFAVGTGTTLTVGMANTQASIDIHFLPTSAGLRRGAVVLYDGSDNVMLTIPLAGTADSPVAALAPNTGIVLDTGGIPAANPYQIALDGAGNLYCANYTSRTVLKIPAGGGSAAVVSLGTPKGLANQNLTGVALDGAGNLFIGDHQNSRVLVVTPAGVVSVLALHGPAPALGFPVALCFDAAGTLFIGDFTSSRVLQVTGVVVSGSTSSGEASVLNTGSYTLAGSTLTGLAVDPFGNVYIAARTQNNSSIVKVTAAGAASLLSLPGISPALSNPQGVAADGFGNVYVVDTGNKRIVKLTTAGVASALALTGLPSPASTLGSTAFGVTLDPSGNLYIPDWTNNRIVFANVSGAALRFASTKVGFTSTDSPGIATVSNLGNQPLVFSTNPTYTAAFSNNTADTNPVTSSTSLAAGLAANVSVNFTPQSVGNLSAGITVTNNTLNLAGSTQQVSVSGAGLNPGDTTSTTVTLSPGSLTNGQAVTITATIADTTAGHTANVPTGSVTFTDTVGGNTTSLNGGAGVSLSAGKAVLSNVLLSGIGTHTIAASYAGVTGSYLASGANATMALAKAPLTLAGPATQPMTSIPGNPVTFTVTAAGPYPSLPPATGSLAWTVLDAASASVASGTATLTVGTGSSSASWTVAAVNLPVGSYTASFTYGGDGNYLASSAATTISLIVARVTPTVTLSVSPNPVTAGSAATCSVTVAGTAATPTGSVEFYDSATLLGAATLASGTATFTIPSMTPGVSHPLSAAYQGDAVYLALTSAVVPESVQQWASSLALAVSGSPDALYLGLPVTLTATLTSANPVAGGTVSFLNGTQILATVPLAAGVATLTLSDLPLGLNPVSALYNGDVADLGSAAAPQNVTVLAPVVTVVVPPAPELTVDNGGTSATQLTLSSLGTLGTPITFTVTGLPPAATCTFDHTTVDVSTGPVVIKVTFTTTPRLLILGQTKGLAPAGGIGAGVLLCGILALPAMRRRKRIGIFLSALALAFFGALTACGGSHHKQGITTGTTGTPAGTYAIAITASAPGATPVTSNLQLTVH